MSDAGIDANGHAVSEEGAARGAADDSDAAFLASAAKRGLIAASVQPKPSP